MGARFLIYGLIDPRDGQLRYVGKSATGMGRPKSLHSAYCLAWERQLRARGLKPDIEVLEEHESAEALPEAERYFIAYFRFIGCRLTNLTAGGDGGATRHGPHTPESKVLMSIAMKGKNTAPKPLSVRLKISDANRRRRLSAKSRLRMSRAQGGRSVRCGEVIYDTASEAARRLGLNQGGISRSANSDGHYLVGGMLFRLAD